MTSSEIKEVLFKRAPYQNIFIPEFTWNGIRIDAITVDLSHRWIRGYEIKINHSDFVRDTKYVLYTQFLSSLTIVCPEEIISPEEIEKPVGLLWISPKEKFYQMTYKRKPKNFQKRHSLSWFWTYLSVLEHELPRMQIMLKEQIKLFDNV
jgi:hypothetical protein